MNPGKITTPLFFLLALLFTAQPVMGLEYLIQPAWEIPLICPDTPADQIPVIHVAERGNLISVNYPYEPGFFVYDGDGSLLFNKTLSAEKTPWITSISPVPDGSGLAVAQLVPGCCHGSVSGTASNKVVFFDRSGRIVWEYPTEKPPLATVILPGSGDIIIGTEDGRILCLDRQGSLRWSASVEAPVISLRASEDGRTIVASGNSNYDAWKQYGEPISPYDLFFLDADGTVLGKFQTRGENTVAISRDASAIAVIGGPLGNLMVFNRTGTKTVEQSFPGTISALSLAGDGSRIIVETSGGRVYCLDENLQERWNLQAAAGPQGMAVSDTMDILAVGENYNVTLYRITGDVIGTYQADSRVRFISEIPGTASFIIATEGKMAFVNLTVEEAHRRPDWITIDALPIGTYSTGDSFTVSGKTGLPLGDEIIFSAYQSQFLAGSPDLLPPTYYGSTLVTVGTDEVNDWSFVVDTTQFRKTMRNGTVIQSNAYPGEYTLSIGPSGMIRQSFTLAETGAAPSIVSVTIPPDNPVNPPLSQTSTPAPVTMIIPFIALVIVVSLLLRKRG